MSNIDLVRLLLSQQPCNRLNNYILPGLRSDLLEGAKVRIFRNTCPTMQIITPHSHRFDFVCYVLRGHVFNRKWEQLNDEPNPAENVHRMWASRLEYQGKPGSYVVVPDDYPTWYQSTVTRYQAGSWYGMEAHEIHDIDFSHNAEVLFLEMPSRTTRTVILEQCVDGMRIPTFEVKDWMFKE